MSFDGSDLSYYAKLVRVLTSSERVRASAIHIGEGASREKLQELLRHIDQVRSQKQSPLTVSYFVDWHRIVAYWDEARQRLVQSSTGMTEVSDFFMACDRTVRDGEKPGTRIVLFRHSSFRIRPGQKSIEYDGEIIVDPVEEK